MVESMPFSGLRVDLAQGEGCDRRQATTQARLRLHRTTATSDLYRWRLSSRRIFPLGLRVPAIAYTGAGAATSIGLNCQLARQWPLS